MKAAIPQMIKAGHGSIVNVGSISSVVGLITQSIYAPTKAAILQLTRQSAVDYASQGIRINCVLPGGMKTPMTQREIDEGDNEELLEKELELLPMGRLADPREVVYAILFLASDEASFITGAALAADGGYTAQ
jgi:NAD(P)-dependent dehydrogenase (short-subunit alcohol dehydrogenase family)